jgi:hypothetical protein
MGTALDHRLVRDYLHQLDAALYTAPSEQARELRDQIAAHLEDALPPDAGDEQIRAALTRLGSPADLVADAHLTPDLPPETNAGRAFRALLASVRPRTWIAAAIVLALLFTGAKLAEHYRSAGPLQYSLGGDWWYPQDAAHQSIAVAGSTTQNTTSLRPGQAQGYVISVYNGTGVTQTILGDGSGPSIGWDNPGSASERVAVSRSYTDIANGLAGERVTAGLSFGLPVSIPPFQSRLVRVLWISRTCLSAGEATGIDQIYLRVRVGWFTRTEIIPQQTWDLVGSSHARC